MSIAIDRPMVRVRPLSLDELGAEIAPGQQCSGAILGGGKRWKRSQKI